MRYSERINTLICISVIVQAIETFADFTARNCSCGYYDATAGFTWTESIIVYFNETIAAPIPGFIEESYSHKYEKGWNTQFRTGADISNINFSNFTPAGESPRSLELHVSPYESDHLVVGSSVRTSRQDIKYGSFTSLLRSPAKSAGGGGSVLSLAVEYNASQSISINLKNTNMPSTACISTLANDESPDTSLVYYDSMNNGSFRNDTMSPWDYTEYSLEWTEDEVKYFIGGNLARSVSKSENEGLLSVPAPLYLRHWSNGLATGSQGPPNQPTVANVGWARLFFNSSLMSEDDHASFDSRCRTSVACPMNDMTLRGSSMYSEKSTKEWKQAPKSRPRRVAAIWLAVASISLTAFLLLSPIWTRLQERWESTPEVETTTQARRQSEHLAHSRAQLPAGLAIDCPPHDQIVEPSIGSATLLESNKSSPTAASFTPSRSSSTCGKPVGTRTFRRRSAFIVDHSFREHESHCEGQTDFGQKTLSERVPPETRISTIPQSRAASTNQSGFVERKEHEMKLAPADEATMIKDWRISWNSVGWEEIEKSTQSSPTTKSPTAREVATPEFPKRETNVNTKVTEGRTSFLDAQPRMGNLAGLLVVSCLLVTAINFNLTFVHGDSMSDGFLHSHSEEIARKTISPFLLNQIWIGPFFLTSSRFLTTSYIRTGDLLAVAEKIVKRTFRLMLPVAAMLMLEYFFVDCGATKWLEFLPSITWSTWPFIKGYSNFGNFLSEVLELIYLIPNAAPVITFNFCTHVLWTIPVQLQGSWTALLAVIVIREVKKPWKRFGFYAFCIVNHWYALSWGSYFYVGIMLTDLDITYKWQTYLHARPLMYYPLLLLCIFLTFAGPTLDLLTHRTEMDYPKQEYSIHPNVTSGLPISEISRAGSLEYFFPRLNGLVFAAGLQTAVEISPTIQKVFSFKLFMLIFPHIFSIYLVHGFIFWTLGSWICIFLAVRGLSYGTNIFIVALCCYAVLALCTPLVTPVIDCLGKRITSDIWRQAREEPAPRRPTLYPFSKDLFLNRSEVTWERKPSKDISVDSQERKVSRSIPRVRKPSKDLRTSWHDRESSVDPRASWLERQSVVDSSINLQERRVSRAVPRDGEPSPEPRTSWYERRPSGDPRTSWHEGEPSAARKVSLQDQEPSMEPKTSLHEPKLSPDLRTSWHERKASKTMRLERVEDVEEESEV